jgi:hypothetical protein
MNKTEANDEENYRRYSERMTGLLKEKLKPSPELPIDQLIIALCAEGMMLLDAEEKAKAAPAMKPSTESKRLSSTLASGDKNPYIRARAQVLAKMDDAHHKQIEDMEAKGDTQNRIYAEFIKEVSKLGDKLSEKKP